MFGFSTTFMILARIASIKKNPHRLIGISPSIFWNRKTLSCHVNVQVDCAAHALISNVNELFDCAAHTCNALTQGKEEFLFSEFICRSEATLVAQW